MTGNDCALTVFYDGACPLCRREIGWYRRRRNDGRIDWLDVSQCADEALPQGLDRPTLLARFHVALPDGRVVSGSSAFAALWLRYPGLRWAGRLARIPPLPLLLELGYRLFLRLRPRLQRLAGCRETCE